MKLQYIVRSAFRTPTEAFYNAQVAFRKPFQYVFLLGHMRCGSSLLTHLLCASPEISGYGETMLNYNRPGALRKLHAKAYYMNRRLIVGRERYLFDKALHDRYFSDDSLRLLEAHKSFLLFMVRDPNDAIPSIVKIMAWDVETATTHYVERLATLKKMIEHCRSSFPAIGLTYDNLVDRPSETLASLTAFLELSHPLSAEYELMTTTGRRAIGDTGPNIAAGRIVRTRCPASRQFQASTKATEAFGAVLDQLAPISAVSDTVDSSSNSAAH